MAKFASFKYVFQVLITSLLLFAVFIPATGQPSAINIRIIKVINNTFPAVKVLVSVSDAQGFPIKDLQPGNFSVSEGGKPVTGITVTPFQNFDQPLAIVMVMDTSGSMKGNPLSDSIKAAKTFNQSLAAQDVVGLVTFAADVKQLQSLTTDRAAIDSQLDSLKAGGATALNDALVEAVGMLKNRSERRVVVLLTDGKQEGPSKYTADQVVDEAVRWSTPIYTIGFGSVDKNQLERFAHLTGGTSQVNPDSTTVSNAFQAVISMLREQYTIGFTSTLLADGLEHPLKVKVEYQNGSAFAEDTIVPLPGPVTVNIVQPVTGQAVGGKVQIRVEGSGPAPLSQATLFIDDQPLANLQQQPFEYLWDSTSVQPGSHTLKVSITDQVGNTGENTLDLTVRLPILAEFTLADNEKIGGQTALPVKVDSLADVVKMVYFADGQQIAELTSAPFDFTWDTRQVAPGPHTLRVQVQDANGYTAEDTVPVMVEMQRTNNLLWVVLVVIAVAAGIIVPLSMRSRRKVAAAAIGSSVEDGTDTYVRVTGKEAAVLVEITGLNPGHVWPLTAHEMKLGRKRSDNDIPLQGLSASRSQAVIEAQQDGYLIRTLVSDNPVIVNGSPITNAGVLCQGDIIEAGESSFRFEVRS